MEHGPTEDDPLGDEDPFEGLVFDDEFVRGAAIVEASAEQRERAARQANLQRLLSDEAARRDNELHAHRRVAAHGDDDPFAVDAERSAPRHGRLVVAVVVIVAIVVVYGMSHFFSGRRDPTPTVETDAQDSPTETPADTTTGDEPAGTTPTYVRPANWPSRSSEEQASPIGQPGPVPEGGGPHTFVQLQPDGARPVAYDPCRPVHYVTRTAGAPEGTSTLLADALVSVSAATGLQFIDDGATDEAPSEERPAFQPDRYGDRWAPVLISWSDAAESPRLAESVELTPAGAVADVLGYAGSTSAGFTDGTTPGDQTFVTGSVTLDAPDFTELLAQFDGYARARAVVLHELGHLVGLDHVDDPTQLMSPVLSNDLTEFAAGDRQGLAAVGQGACFPEV